MNILIKDADPITTLGLKQLQYSITCKTVDTTSTEDHLLECLHQKTYNLIIIDSAPSFQETGLLIKRIKTYCEDCNILVYGDLKSKKYELQFISYGASGYLAKGCSEQEIVSAINMISNGQLYISQDALQHNVIASDFVRQRKTLYKKKLSKREQEVFALLLEGKSVNGISEKLNLKQSTISTLKKRILIKFEVTNLVELVRKVDKHQYREKLID